MKMGFLFLRFWKRKFRAIWTKEGKDAYSGEKCYKFIVEQNSTWYSIIGMWKDKEDAKQELVAYGYKIVG